MRDIITVAKKELRAYFTDKVILIQIFLLPFIIVFGYCTLFSVLAAPLNSDSDEAKIKGYYINCPIYFVEAIQGLDLVEAPKSDPESIEKYKEQIRTKDLDILLVFPDDFAIAEPGSKDLSNIDMYYNSSNPKSTSISSLLASVFDAIQPRIFTVNDRMEEGDYNLIDVDNEFGKLLGGIIPTIVFMAVFMICMNLASNSIAGDKEHGFLNTLLVTPIKRRDLAAGKSFTILVVSILSSLSAFIGMAFSLPKISESIGLGETQFGFSAYLSLFLSMVTAILVLSALLLIVSTISKDVKQATTISPAFLFLIMIPSLLSSTEGFGSLVNKFGSWNYFVPVWNSVKFMQDIMSSDYSVKYVVPICFINILVATLSVLAVGKLFEDERIVNNG